MSWLSGILTHSGFDVRLFRGGVEGSAVRTGGLAELHSHTKSLSANPESRSKLQWSLSLSRSLSSLCL